MLCVSTDENIRFNRKPLSTNNEHDYSVWNINNDDYDDMDLSEYLIDTKEESHPLMDEPIYQTPAVDETQNFDAPTPSKAARRYSCPVCGKLWVTPSKLKRHMSVHRNAKQQKEQQPKVEVKKPSFSSPIFYDPPKKEPEVQCPICFLAIESPSKLPQHMIVHIKTENRVEPKAVRVEPAPIAQKIGKRYICTVCGSQFLSPAKLTNHMKAQHMRKVSIISNGMSPKVPEKMRPISSRHRRNICNICSKTFQSSSKLTRHLKSHQRTKPAVRRQRPRNHACQYCEKHFETPSKLLRHQTVHRDLLKSEHIDAPPILEISTVTSILGD